MSLPSAGGRAIVTGASSGIGSAFALALDKMGCSVILVGRDEKLLRRLSEDMSHRPEIIVANLATHHGVQSVVEACPSRLDVLVHSAGVFYSDPVHHIAPGQWDDLFNVNLRAPMILTSSCLPPLTASAGQVVFLNSTAALSPGGTNSAYASIKQALKTNVDALRRESRGSNIRFLSIFPGRTDTPMQRNILKDEGRPVTDVMMLSKEDVADAAIAALNLPRHAEVTDLIIRPKNG